MGRAGRLDPFERRRVGQVEPLRVGAFGGEEVGRLCHPGVGEAGQHRLHRVQRAGGDGFWRHLLVDDLVDEGGVGAVLEKPADEVGEKVAVRADRGVDAAACAFPLQHDVVEPLAHAVKALELEGLALAHVEHRGDGVGVVGGELRIDPVGHAEELLRIGDVADVGRLLAGEDREVLEPQHLRALDLGVPVGALDEADHDPAVEPPAQRVEPVDHRPGAAAVGLHDDAEPVPALQLRVGQHRLDHLERQAEPLRLLGVDVEAHPGLRRGAGEVAHHRHEFRHDAGLLCHLVAGMERGELDRDAGVGADIVAAGRRRDGGDGAGIGMGVALGVLGGLRRLAQHVVGIAVALRLHLRGAFHRGVDRLAEDELAAHLLHRLADSAADHRLAEPLHRAAQVADDARLLLFEHLAGQHQRPGRGVDEAGGGTSEVAAPVGRRDLVLDQRVHRLGVGHAQQRLGQAHQRDALLGREAVFGEEDLHQAGAHVGADLADEGRAPGGDAGAVGRGKGGGADQAGEQRRLGPERAGFDFVPVVGPVLGHGRSPDAGAHDSA